MTSLPNGDELPSPLHDRLGSRRTHLVPISFLHPADSPRLTGEDEEHARLLADSQAPLPPIVVHRATMRVIDGMHRLRAAALRGDAHIEAFLVDGSQEDAFVLAVQLNSEHGLPLSRQDRAAAAGRIIASHPHWSDRRIASVTGLSPGAIGALRGRSGLPAQALALRTGRDGRSRPVNGAAGRIAASRVVAEFPDASLREIAARAGVALATARDVRNRMRLGLDPVPPKLRAAQGDRPPEGDPGRIAVREVAGAGEPPAAAQPSPEQAGAAPDAAQPLPEPGEPLPAPAAVISASVLARMRRDPSLRMSQSGRALLHLLASHLLIDEQRHDLVAGVPAHRAADVAHAARLCAEQWLRFATAVEGVRAQCEDALPGRTPMPSLSTGA